MSQMTLGFKYDGTLMNIQCKGNDTLNSVFNRYCVKAGLQQKNPVFYFNGKKIVGEDKNKAIVEYGVPNLGVFDVVLTDYVIGAKIN